MSTKVVLVYNNVFLDYSLVTISDKVPGLADAASYLFYLHDIFFNWTQ